MKTLTPEQVALLRSPLPDEAISKHPTKTYLSSIKAIYVIERLNHVFGIGSWRVKNEVIKGEMPMIVVKSTLTIPDYGIEIENFGGNDNGGEGSKNFDLGDAYKGACTDALTKICSYLEIGMEVFKGKHKSGTITATPSASPTNSVKWLSEADFLKALNSDKKGIEATLKFFSSDTHKMKADYKTKLTEKLNAIKN